MTKEKKSTLTFTAALMITAGLVLIALALRFLLFGQDQPPASGSPKTATISAAQVARVHLKDSKMAYDSGSAVFLDVRSQSSFETSHIPGSLNIPLFELESRLNELHPNDWTITYCT